MAESPLRSRKSVSLRVVDVDLNTSSQRTREFPGSKELFPSLDKAKESVEDKHASVWEPSFDDVDSQSEEEDEDEIIEEGEEDDEDDEDAEGTTQELLATLEKLKKQLQDSKDKKKVENANKLLKLLEDSLNE